MLSLNDAPQAVHLNAAAVTILVGTVLPLLAGLATKHSSKLTGVILVLLNAVNAVVVKAVVPDGGAVITAQTLVFGLLGVISSMAAYYNVWKPFGVTNNPDNPSGQAKLGADKGLS